MFKHTCRPRENWVEKVLTTRMEYWQMEHEGKFIPYWDESHYYEFSVEEIEMIKTATSSLHACNDEVVKYLTSGEDFSTEQLGLPEGSLEVIAETYKKNPFSLYGRFDFGYNENSGELKMLEYNADTPTGIVDMLTQWKWCEDKFPHTEQFNTVQDSLIRQWAKAKFRVNRIYFAYCNTAYPEDRLNVEAIMECAEMAGRNVKLIEMQDIGWNPHNKTFVDASGTPDSYTEEGDEVRIDACFKLYPWEDMLNEPFGRYILDDPEKLHWIEPVWKELLSNKLYLVAMSRLFPDHPNVLPTFYGSSENLEWWVGKPLFGREGANIIFNSPFHQLKTDGLYGSEGYIYQKWFDVMPHDGRYPTIGSWIIGDTPAGISVRDSDKPIIDTTCTIVPHVVDSPRGL